MPKQIKTWRDTYEMGLDGKYRSVWGTRRTLKCDWAGGPSRTLGGGYVVETSRSSGWSMPRSHSYSKKERAHSNSYANRRASANPVKIGFAIVGAFYKGIEMLVVTGEKIFGGK